MLGDIYLVRMADQTLDDISYANFQLLLGEETFASAFIQLDVNFGMRRIRRALCDSLQYKCEVKLSTRDLRRRGTGRQGDRNGVQNPTLQSSSPC